MKAAVYARVSTADQTCDNQLLELRRYVEARGWTTVEYVDHGVSGAKESRPALDALVKDVNRRVWSSLRRGLFFQVCNSGREHPVAKLVQYGEPF